MKAPLSFAILIAIFSEPFFTVGSPQHLDINEQLSATHPNEETDRSDGSCQTIKVTLKGRALKAHGGQIGIFGPFGPLQGFYNRTTDVCGKPSWSKRIRHNGLLYRNQRIWWHSRFDGSADSECGKKVSKGHGKDYWKIGSLNRKLSGFGVTGLGGMDTYDRANFVDNDAPYLYDHRRSVWSYWDWLPNVENPGDAMKWVGPTREIDVSCVIYTPRGDGPFEKEGEV